MSYDKCINSKKINKSCFVCNGALTVLSVKETEIFFWNFTFHFSFLATLFLVSPLV